MMIFDAHNDLLTAEITDSDKAGVLNGYKESGVLDGVTLAVWTTERIKSAGDIFALISQLHTPHSTLRTTFAVEDIGFADDKDIEELASGACSDVSDRAEGCHLCGDQASLAQSGGFAYISLTWNNDNKFAGGAYGTGGLTEAGARAVKKLSSNTYIDCVHLNQKSFYGIADITDKIIVSHTAFSGVRKHPRNISDEQIKIILERGRGCGLALVGDFLSPSKADISDVVRHIDYFVQKFGGSGLFIGTDFFGTDDLPEGLTDYDSFYALKYRLESLGYPDSAIKNIFSENYPRIINNFI